MASFMRKLAPQLVTPDRQLSYFLPDILSFARIFSPGEQSADCLPPSTPHLPTYSRELPAVGLSTYLPIQTSVWSTTDPLSGKCAEPPGNVVGPDVKSCFI